MAAETVLVDSRAAPLRFANGTTLEGLSGAGVLHQRRPDGKRLRSASLPAELDTHPAFQAELDRWGIREQETLVLEADGGVGSVGARDDTVVLTPAVDAGDAAPRVVLYVDESGGLSWHFAQAASAGAASSSGRRGRLRSAAASPRFMIPLRSRATAETLREGQPRRSLRGPITKIGRKIFKVLVLPLASALIQDPVRWMAEKVEGHLCGHLVWHPRPDTYRAKPDPALPFAEWQRLTGGPVLLLVHGIFSSVQGMLARLPVSVMEDWHARYQGRVIAFNHPTVSASPEHNARVLLQQLHAALPGKPLTLDIICHSRGGIVARALAERGQALLPDCQAHVRSVYFVATPNAGSPLGDADHMVDMIDLFTNVLGNFDDGPLTYSMEVIVGLVMLLGHAGVTALPGIASLGTRGSYITDVLNRASARSAAHYGAAAADFEPQRGRENGWIIDRLGDPLMDRVFTREGQRVPNDLVVPQQGVFAANGHPSFPIADALVYQAGDGIWHSSFFAQARTLEHLAAHLDRVAEQAQARAGLRAPRGGDEARRTLGAGMGGRAPRISDERAAAPLPAGLDSDRVLGAGPGSRTDRLSGHPRGRLRDGGSGGRPPKAVAERAPDTGQGAKPRRASTEAAAVQRDPQIQFHEYLEAGRSADLLVLLQLPGAAPAPAGRMTLAFDPGSDEVELDAELSAPGFTVNGQRHARLRVKRRRDPKLEQATFKLTAKDPGANPVLRTIIVSFFRDNECVGSVTHHTTVGPVGYNGPLINEADSATPVRVATERRESPDLVINLRRPDKGLDVFELTMRSQLVGREYEAREFGSFDLNGQDLAGYIADFIDPAFLKFPGDNLSDAQFNAELPKWNKTFLTALADLGTGLWTQLPQPFRDEYLRLAGHLEPPRSIQVFSDELAFPWELVRPSGQVNGKFFEFPALGVAHVIGRWRPGVDTRPQPQRMAVAHVALVMPDAIAGGLPWAAQEVRTLQTLLPGSQLLSPVTRAEVDLLLAGGEAQIVHFAGHGALGANPDLTRLDLEGGTSVPAVAFAASRLASTHKPLLVLNACSVGRGAQVMGRAGGFASMCIEGGWSGVVAPYWKVYDPAASEFAVTFYRKLRSGLSVGEALNELRRERSDDPTALSYAYFGDPFARLSIAA